MLDFGNIGDISNRETWTGLLELRDDDTDELFDVSDATAIKIKVCSEETGDYLTGSLSNATISHITTGLIQWVFTVTQMRTLCPGEYEVGLTFEFSNETIQAGVWLVDVVDGIVD